MLALFSDEAQPWEANDTRKKTKMETTLENEMQIKADIDAEPTEKNRRSRERSVRLEKHKQEGRRQGQEGEG